MNLFKKMAVLAAALMLLSVFVSCDNNAEESDAAVVAEFDGYPYYGPVGARARGLELYLPDEPSDDVEVAPIGKATFYDDNTFKVVAYESFLKYFSGDDRAAEKSAEFANGTYEGDPTKDGIINSSLDNILNPETLKLEEVKDSDSIKSGTIEIIKGEFDFFCFHFVRTEE